jgi:hypothetical protein
VLRTKSAKIEWEVLIETLEFNGFTRCKEAASVRLRGSSSAGLRDANLFGLAAQDGFAALHWNQSCMNEREVSPGADVAGFSDGAFSQEGPADLERESCMSWGPCVW